MGRYKNEAIRPVWAEIDLEALSHNLAEVRRLVGPAVEIMAVVKAEGYGHGAVETAKIAMKQGAGWLGVSLPEEGIALRKAGIAAPILVFEPLQTNQANVFLEYDLVATGCIREAMVALAREASQTGKEAKVHLKVDTGMGRIGIDTNEASAFITKVSELPGVKITGLYSHLATADERNKNYAERQIKVFSNLVESLKTAGLLPEKVHLSNSAAIIDLPNSYFNMVRPGIMLYGLYPSEEVHREKVNLKPALSLKTKIVFRKRVLAGSGISYGLRYQTTRETTIITIPIGYADGWSRILSQKAQALIGGKKFPIVGTICMDQCMIDAGDEPVELGQEVVLIGKQGEEHITADMVARQMGTINYEVTCMISDRVPRIYINSMKALTNGLSEESMKISQVQE
jgi:alanine racemase